jgi:RecB family exonuclease
MGDIYNRFTDSLLKDRLAYDGLLQKEVIKEINADSFTSNYYAFIGFNRLDKTEQEMFSVLENAGKALFYWDYDVSYLNDKHEAGMFLRRNISRFPNRLESVHFNNFNEEKQITIIESSTDNAQARYIKYWIEDLPCKADKETAIVLCDERMLQPALHCMPSDKMETVNITMGFPLAETSAYSLFDSLLELQISAMKSLNRFRTDAILRLLSHPLVARLSDKVNELRNIVLKHNSQYHTSNQLQCDDRIDFLFQGTTDNISLLNYLLDTLRKLIPFIEKQSEDTLFLPLNEEAIFRIFTQINRFNEMVKEGRLEIKTDTLCKLIRKVLSGISIPFHGEPIVGMQVMGLLESRNLDFKHILLLSANEGVLPNKSSESSFLPYNLRVAFGLTTMKEKSAVSSYNFYHLIQRAESVTMVYNGNADAPGISKGLISRYLLQLMVDRKEQIKRFSLDTIRIDSENVPIRVEKSSSVLSSLCNVYDADLESKYYLSPTVINSYIDCPLKFYLKNIAKIEFSKRQSEEIDYSQFGNIFHKSAELTYNYLASLSSDRTIDKESLNRLLKEKAILKGFIRQAFKEELFDNTDVSFEDYSSIQALNFEVITRYMEQLLKMDRDLYAPFEYISSETKAYKHIVQTAHPFKKGEKINVRLQGYMDRVDSKNGIIRIVDYKTGGKKDIPKSIDEMFAKKVKRNYHAMQIFYYAYIMCMQKDMRKSMIAPTLLYTRASYSPVKEDIYYVMGGQPITDFRNTCMADFEKKLMEVIDEIFNPYIPFSQTEVEDNCKYCEYARICKKGV